MLKPTPARVILALLGGLALILIAAWSSGLHHQICKEAQTNQENCATYNLAPFVIIQIFKALDAASVAITALATIAIGWFTFTLWRANTGTLKVVLDSVQLARKLQAPERDWSDISKCRFYVEMDPDYEYED